MVAITWVYGDGQVTDRDDFWARVRSGLQAARAHSRLTQREVAARIGVPYETYRGWERGLSEVRLDRINAIAEALELSPTDLLREMGLVDNALDPGSALDRELERLFGPRERDDVKRIMLGLASLPYSERQVALRMIGGLLADAAEAAS